MNVVEVVVPAEDERRDAISTIAQTRNAIAAFQRLRTIIQIHSRPYCGFTNASNAATTPAGRSCPVVHSSNRTANRKERNVCAFPSA